MVSAPGAKLVERQSYLSAPETKPDYRDAVVGWGQCAVSYNALNTLHDGLIDWALRVPVEGDE